MAALRLSEIATATGGRVVGGSPDLLFRAYGIDSRTAVRGELFFAVAGRRDGWKLSMSARATHSPVGRDGRDERSSCASLSAS